MLRMLCRRPDLVTRTELTFDDSAFVTQAVGGTLAQPGNDANTLKIGTKIYTAGLAIQQLFVAGFFVLLVIFHMKMAKGVGRADRPGWQKITYAMYASLLLISIRIIYRLNEFAVEGGNVQLVTHEAYLYILDATLMFLCLLIWNVIHPGTILIGPGSEFEPTPPGWFRRFCCCCCAVNRKTGWQRKYSERVNNTNIELGNGPVKPLPPHPMSPIKNGPAFATVYDYQRVNHQSAY